MSSDIQQRSNVKQAVPFFMVADMETSLEFYTIGLGFELKIKWEPIGKIEWCWLQLGDAAIMLQEYRIHPIPEPPGQGVSICFLCEDAVSIYREINSRGLKSNEPFVGNNLWVVQVTDPDGYQLFFESPTDVPEETRYSDWEIHRKQIKPRTYKSIAIRRVFGLVLTSNRAAYQMPKVI